MPRLASAVTASLLAVLILPLIVFAALTGKVSACTGMTPPIRATSAWDDEQRANALIIVNVGQEQAVPVWGQVIAVAAAMQESGLRNLPDGDRDSIGLFQQRPSQGWGTPLQLRSPTYQAQQFYEALAAVPDWQTLPLTVATQKVQKSATPYAYAQWTEDAFNLVLQEHEPAPSPTASIADQSPTTSGCAEDEGDGLPDVPFARSPRYTFPADASPEAATAIAWATQQLGTPYSYGGDCTAPHSGDPSRQCDCSSLTQQAYRAAGISLPRTTLQQVHVGVAIPMSAMAPGDLVFIPGSEGTITSPRHVGLYLGDGLIIHAPHTGARIRIAELAAWNPIATVRRIS